MQETDTAASPKYRPAGPLKDGKAQLLVFALGFATAVLVLVLFKGSGRLQHLTEYVFLAFGALGLSVILGVLGEVRTKVKDKLRLLCCYTLSYSISSLILVKLQ